MAYTTPAVADGGYKAHYKATTGSGAAMQVKQQVIATAC